MCFKPGVVLGILIILGGCTTLQENGKRQSAESINGAHSSNSALSNLVSSPLSTPNPVQVATESEVIARSNTPFIRKGNDVMVAVSSRDFSAEEMRVGTDEPLLINFDSAPLEQVVHTVLGEILKLDYVIDHPISGEVTLRTSSAVTSNQLLPVLETLLEANNVSLVRDRDNRYFVRPGDRNRQGLPGIASLATAGPGQNNVIIPLRYISASQMAEILQPVTPPENILRVDSVRNILLLSGNQNQIDGWMDIVNAFDVDLLNGMSIGIFPLANSRVADMTRAIRTLMGESDSSGETQSMASVIRILPLESLGSIIVVTSRAHYLSKIQEWIERLDEFADAENEKQLYIYPVQNSSATQVAELLNSLFSGDQRSNGISNTVTAPGTTPSRVSTESDQEQVVTSTSPSSSSGGYSLTDRVRVVADENNNALLIYASARDYNRLVDALRRLDIQPAQVLIEASILEVTLRDELQYGLEWFFRNGLGNRSGSGLLSLGGASIGPRTPGFSYSVSNSVGDIRAVINALAEDSLLKVISTPSVLVLDNHTATIQVGNQQPIRSAQSVTDGGVITSSIQYKDTGVKLVVTPSVNAGGMVTMDIEQAVTDVGEEDSATGQRSFLERSIKSRVAVRSGETVVLGGLIRDNVSESRSGIPVLHTMPVVGNLFGRTSRNEARTELLVMITPRALFNDDEIRSVGQELRSRMKSLEGLRHSE